MAKDFVKFMVVVAVLYIGWSNPLAYAFVSLLTWGKDS